MLELRLTQTSLLKKVLESIKDLITDANFGCSATGFSLQAMDSRHVALVTLVLRSDGFERYRCHRNISMGMDLANMAKMLRCASDDEIVTIKADDGGDIVTFMFDSPYKISGYEMKLMDIDSEHLGIPEAEYQAIVQMPASEFDQICKDLGTIGDTVIIFVTKEGVQFSTKGDIGTVSITSRKSTVVKKEETTVIETEEPVLLTFASRYLIAFTKASPLAGQVTISMSYDTPIVVEHKMEDMGYIRFYLAPKIEEEVTGPMVENVPKVDTKTKADVKPKVGKKNFRRIKSRELIEIKEASELKVETNPKLEKIEIDYESEPKVESNSKPDIKSIEETEIDETKPDMEANAEVEVMDVK